MDQRVSTAQAITFPAADGYPLKGFRWQHANVDVARPVVVINAATSVRCRYYARFAAMHAPTLAMSLSDDEFGTVAAIRRLLGYYRNSARTHLHLRPEAIGEKQVGHFAFFNSRYEQTLWRIPLEWLRHGRLPAQPQGEVQTLRAQARA
ncbi:hypothetical protein [Azospira restricta]|uniref:Uncharacterized protein n=1 Tax=Azospira restricta TaxID=404405 RepID=A0A974SNL5_9RHOO|nr:hypothetical protein [Azospira restricta]QRJ63323.1 hypothetical protein IWH25_16490 [Azospira restricta]